MSYCSGPSTPFAAVAALHPSFVDKEIASQISIPIFVIASKDEPEEDVPRFMGDLNPRIKYKDYTMFPRMVHGWLSARGDLKNAGVREAYDKGYKLMLDFFGKRL